MTGMLRVPRSRGALSGVLLILLGLWGGFVPFVGPYADFAYTPNEPWVLTTDRFWLQVVPALATGIGGLIVLLSANRPLAMFGAWLAALGGAWFVVGQPVSRLWTDTAAGAAGTPVGGQARQVAEQLTFFLGLGALIVFFAALALGRFSVIGVKEARLGEAAEREREYGREHGYEPATGPGRHERPPAAAREPAAAPQPPAPAPAGGSAQEGFAGAPVMPPTAAPAGSAAEGRYARSRTQPLPQPGPQPQAPADAGPPMAQAPGPAAPQPPADRLVAARPRGGEDAER